MGKNKILITGANSGVGASLVSFLSERYDVIALARNTEEIIEKDNVFKYKVDLIEEKELDNLLDQIVEEQGYIPYLINNAGIMHQSKIENLSLTDLEYSIKVNAYAPLQIMNKLLPLMKLNNYGRIINLTSGAPLNCMEGFAAYSASKAALNAITETASKEYKDYNIKINLMSPGPCKTKMAPNGVMDPSVCHPTVDYLLNLDEQTITEGLYWLGYQIPLKPELSGIEWLKGTADERYKKIL
ncbi:SDR family NAD(P)-dependent oxidoreductase [Lysinibacillus sp. JNUCC-52]|uniref:SDR family NAD(P)-dependent oxidoreductase n=1 Tax=Lysinibacillus sp. JNUCC-52 TaxID=2792480 RepID=UPI0019355511|nr:SDR family NAD(P)-dependent oxidoreductase [Lysinibacillus sp. JNUCC-52]